MKHHQACAALRDAFTELYRVEETARTMAIDAGLDLGQIAFSGRVKDVWTAILDEAEKQNAIADLVRVARQEYPHYPPLDAAVDAYAEAWVTDPQTPGARASELAYLAKIIADYEYWAQHYTPLAGIAEVRRAAQGGPRLDLPLLFMPTGFEKLAEHGFGPDRRVERVPVDSSTYSTTWAQPRVSVFSGRWRVTRSYACGRNGETRVLPGKNSGRSTRCQMPSTGPMTAGRGVQGRIPQNRSDTAAHPICPITRWWVSPGTRPMPSAAG